MTDNPTPDRQAQLFLSLVTSMHMGAMYQLGKVASPMTGDIERNLEQAQYTIDLLGMLETRTDGNLSETEKDLLSRTLSELRMNYIDESAKPNAAINSEETSDTSDTTEAAAVAETPESAEPKEDATE